MNFYKLYTEMMAQGEYDKLERGGQGNMKNRRALLQQGILDKVNTNEQMVPDWMIRNFTHIFDKRMKDEMTYKELSIIAEQQYKMRILDKGEIYRPRSDSLRFIVILNSSKIILAEGNAIHEDLVHMAMLSNLLPMKSGLSGFNFANNSSMFTQAVAFYLQDTTVYLSESYYPNATKFFKRREDICEKYTDIINSTLFGIKKIYFTPATDVED